VDADLLRREVRKMYEQVAAEPGGDYHFHRGPEYAAGFLGYDPGELAELPEATTASFAGVGNPLAIGPLYPGETVVDIGSGAGTDLLLAARRIGPQGKAIGVDMTEAMREKAQAGARAIGLANVEIRAGDAEA